MKTKYFRILCLGALALSYSGCAGMFGMGRPEESGKDIATVGPTVLNAHTEPEIVELDVRLQPSQRAQIVADVKYFQSNITEVRVEFIHVPVSIAMKNVGGTTWVAELNSEDLKKLAISGQTIRYEANIVAKDKNGQTGVSREPVEVSIKTADITKS